MRHADRPRKQFSAEYTLASVQWAPATASFPLLGAIYLYLFVLLLHTLAVSLSVCLCLSLCIHSNANKSTSTDKEDATKAAAGGAVPGSTEQSSLAVKEGANQGASSSVSAAEVLNWSVVLSSSSRFCVSPSAAATMLVRPIPDCDNGQ